jgi:NAD(P)-dependent dehydrogenase (short-subunit alcohol dehydrogenase family)
MGRWLGAGLLAGGAALRWLSRVRGPSLTGEVALITGGSRGLGLALARELGSRGSRVVICARDAAELQRAEEDLRRRNIAVLALPCDVTDPDQVQQLITTVVDETGRLDMLVNNAGMIQVGPLDSLDRDDFVQAQDAMFYGVLNPVLAALPHLRDRGRGCIVNITSVGGKVAVPHLLPYCCAKFAAVGLSEGLRAELSGTGVTVTTVIPGLMRTGSYTNALVKGAKEKELAWFGVGASLPGLTVSAERAARRIVLAAARGEAEVVLGLPAKLLTFMHDLAPGFTLDLLGFINRTGLPVSDGSHDIESGFSVEDRLRSAAYQRITHLGRTAGAQLNQPRPPAFHNGHSPSPGEPGGEIHPSSS